MYITTDFLAQCAKDKIAIMNLYRDEVKWLTLAAEEQNLVNGQFFITETHFVAWTAHKVLYLWKIKSCPAASPIRFDVGTSAYVLGMSREILIMLEQNRWIFCDTRTGCISMQDYVPPYEDLILQSFALASNFAYIYLEADEHAVSQFLCIFSIQHEPHCEMRCQEIVDICDLDRGTDSGALLTYQNKVIYRCSDLDGFYWHKWIWYELTCGSMIKRDAWDEDYGVSLTEPICHPEWLSWWYVNRVNRTPHGAYFALEQRVGTTRSSVSGPEIADIAQVIDDMHIALGVPCNDSQLGEPFCSRVELLGDRDFAIIVHEDCSIMETRRFFALAHEL